jgi:hypothetical protein
VLALDARLSPTELGLRAELVQPLEILFERQGRTSF